MTTTPHAADAARSPLRLKELASADVRAAFARAPILIIPVGTCEHHGPHLPLGCDTIVVERLADELSAATGVVRAPAVEFGVNDVAAAGSASVRRKTLRRWLNDLLVDWERQGIRDFLILTMSGHAAHQEALGTIVTERARVRVVDILAFDLSPFLDEPHGPIHGGEADTSLVLHVAPHLVRMDLARDCILPEAERRRYRRGSRLKLPERADGSVGLATRATAGKGRSIYQHIMTRLVRYLADANSGAATG